jgi:hypothetical protein
MTADDLTVARLVAAILYASGKRPGTADIDDRL